MLKTHSLSYKCLIGPCDSIILARHVDKPLVVGSPRYPGLEKKKS